MTGAASGRTPTERSPISDQSLTRRVSRALFGPARDLGDQAVFKRISLVALLAWVGLGADGLSSSAYGPEEAFRSLGSHSALALVLALMTALTVSIIAYAYGHIVEEFPHGGGGYLVATKLLGPRLGVISGCALLVDYVMTIAVSIAAAGDALFSFVPTAAQPYKLVAEIALIVVLTAINIRGVRESVLVLAPIFALFVLTHLLVIVNGVAVHVADLPATVRAVGVDAGQSISTLGVGGTLLLIVYAYSFGGGTYTGIEAVSNGMPIMREPRVTTARRTMLYMAVSLAFTAGGLLLCYVLWRIAPAPGKTLNAVLVEQMTGNLPGGFAIAVVTLVSEGALLVVAAQAGFIDGPRVMANLAIDSWLPRRLSALSDRLTTANGILLMGATSLLALVCAAGNVGALIFMYSINVFLTFSLSMLGMLLAWWRRRDSLLRWRRLATFGSGLCLCATILAITVVEKFGQGGWLTLVVTGGLVGLCLVVRRHYRRVGDKLFDLYAMVELASTPSSGHPPPRLDPLQPTAALLVGSYSGLGIHTVLDIQRTFPDFFCNLVFVSVGAVDSGVFKGRENLERLRLKTENELKDFVALANSLGLAGAYRCAIATDVVDEATRLCLEIGHEFPRVTFFAGKLIFERENWYHRLLHNDTAFAVQKRLQLAGYPLMVIPAVIG